MNKQEQNRHIAGTLLLIFILGAIIVAAIAVHYKPEQTYRRDSSEKKEVINNPIK